jgi:nitroimidazol reductase NimA-like FMN-containing flavoprotein (pyridoxamine 5'-phosphate oxidase superfamily)
MHETADDVARLQALLDRSYESAGRHLRDVITPERRLSAADLASRLTGMRLLVLATTARDGRPMAAPVDGIFYRGAWHFGTAPDSRRLAHIRRDPRVSAVHLPSEELSVTVHGRTTLLDLATAGEAGFRRALLDIYVPRYGPEWEDFLDGGPL